MLKYKETQNIIHGTFRYLSVDIFDLKDASFNDQQIFDRLIHSKKYQWNYESYPNGFSGEITHGPYLINKIQTTDYIQISLDQMLSGINTTIKDEILYADNDEKRQNANRQFQREVDRLLDNIGQDCLRYYHLKLELSTENELLNNYDKMAKRRKFSFFNSYVAISNTRLFLIKLGDA